MREITTRCLSSVYIAKISTYKYQSNSDAWRNGSALDSSPKGCVFDSRRVQSFFLSFCLLVKDAIKQTSPLHDHKRHFFTLVKELGWSVWAIFLI